MQQAAGRGPTIYTGYAKQLEPGEALPAGAAGEALLLGRTCMPLEGAVEGVTVPDAQGRVWLLRRAADGALSLQRRGWGTESEAATPLGATQAALAETGDVVFLAASSTAVDLSADASAQVGRPDSQRRPPAAKRAALAAVRRRVAHEAAGNTLGLLRADGSIASLSTPEQRVTSFALDGDKVWFTVAEADEADGTDAGHLWRATLREPVASRPVSVVANRVWGALEGGARVVVNATEGGNPALVVVGIESGERVLLGPPPPAVVVDHGAVWWRDGAGQTYRWSGQSPAALPEQQTGVVLLGGGLPAAQWRLQPPDERCPQGESQLGWLDGAGTLRAQRWCQYDADGSVLLAAWPYAASAELTLLGAVVVRPPPLPDWSSLPDQTFGPPQPLPPSYELCLYARTAEPLRRL